MTKKTDFWEELEKAAKLARQRSLEEMGTVVSAQRHPEFHRSIADLAKRAGLNYHPDVLVTDSLSIGPVWIRKLPNAAASPPARVVMVSKSMMELTGSSLHRPVSPMLETVIAHEFSHLKDGTLSVVASHLGPWMLPLVAMAGLHLYDRARQNTPESIDQSKNDYLQQLEKNIHITADGEIATYKSKADKNKDWHIDPDWHESTTNAGRYAMAAAIAFGVGLLGARMHGRNVEFRADKLAVDVTGNPELFKRFFVEMQKVWKDAAKNRPRNDTMFKEIKEAWDHLMADTIHAHPSMEERLKYIDKVAAERLAKSTSSGKPATAHLF